MLLSCVEPLKIVLHLYIFSYLRKPEKKVILMYVF